MSSNSSTKVCFNSKCKAPLERSRKGWRRRTGDFADLCERCASSYEEGKFCQTFHMPASGWRCCESCGKQIHCGCIVSFHMFVLLDAGGIECISCARKSFILTPNPAWPPPSLFLPVNSERNKDASPRSWCQIAGSGPVPWRQAPSLFSSLSVQPDMQPRVPSEQSAIDINTVHERISASISENKKAEGSDMLINGSLKFAASQLLKNGNAGVNYGDLVNSYINVPQRQSFLRNNQSASPFALAPSFASPHEGNDRNNVVIAQPPRLTPALLNGKQLSGLKKDDSLIEPQIRNGKPGDARAQTQLLPRYWPRTTDQELQKISGGSNSIITPLFEKMLSASDAGRVGRLVLPKKCAEAYFPRISQPEGLPLKIQDSKGNEWVFQFRFWPNNNSRMYVLEGITPCMQSMQLQAGDIITFSRMDPEGKLLMGFRKASTVSSSDQGGGAVNSLNGGSINVDVSSNKPKVGELLSTDKLKRDAPTVDKAILTQQTIPWLKDERYGCVAKEVVEAVCSKRRQNTLGSNNKRFRIEGEEPSELYLTAKEAQQVLRPPPGCGPSSVVIEGVEIEEYQVGPIFGRPTIFAMDIMGQLFQWAQCEDCFKWRKVPANAVLPLRWTCSGNQWDPERSSCPAAQELTVEQLEYLLNPDDSKTTREDPASAEPLGLAALADLAIQEKGETSSQATSKHPRHRAGCSCIVCIQPSSGKGPKHKPTCNCVVCLSLKRRCNTLMLRREMKQLAKQKLQQRHLLEEVSEDTEISNPNQRTANIQIDLNMQPYKDEEPSHGPESASAVKLLQDAYPDIQSDEDKDSSDNVSDEEEFASVRAANVPTSTPDAEPKKHTSIEG